MNDDRRKPLWPWIVSLLIGLPVLYVGSYAALVNGTLFAYKAPFPSDPPFIRPRDPIYSVLVPMIGNLGTGKDGWVGRAFAPVHRIDRKLRPEYWTFRDNP